MHPVVIKIGGSLYPHVPSIITAVKESKRPCLIIAGGGAWADRVRAKNLPDDTAHWMAVFAMEKYGRYISEYGVPVEQPDSHSLMIPSDQRVLLPYQYLHEVDSFPGALPHSWDVTSDSISLFFAHRLSLPLLILKSIDRIRIDGKEASHITSAMRSRTDDLDAFFLPYAHSLSVPITIVNGQYPERVFAALCEKEVIGTKIATCTVGKLSKMNSMANKSER
ncbi:MAG: uridylate kinase [Methanomicrobiales archaeon]|jgi:aspartokinase-like uncharacterized kinase|nr:uridylate kinase [Methanomicrobiales archaeon]